MIQFSTYLHIFPRKLHSKVQHSRKNRLHTLNKRIKYHYITHNILASRFNPAKLPPPRNQERNPSDNKYARVSSNKRIQPYPFDTG